MTNDDSQTDYDAPDPPSQGAPELQRRPEEGLAEGAEVLGNGNSPETERRFFHEIHVMRGAILLVAAGVLVAFLYLARVILIPIVLAVFLAYVLNPLVSGLERLKIPKTDIRMPRTLATTAVVLMTVALTTALGVVLADQVRQLGAELPQYADRITDDARQIRERLLEFEEDIEKALEPIRRNPDEKRGEPEAGAGTGANVGARPQQSGPRTPSQMPEGRTTTTQPPPIPAAPSQQSVVVDQAGDLWVSASSYLAGSLTGLVGVLVQALTCVFVLFFTLIQAPAFKTKLLRIMGTTDSRREAILEVLRDINRDVQGYLFGRFLINTILAMIVSLSFFAYGLRYSLLIGILAGLLNFIPYVGAIIGMFFPAVVAYMQFGTPSAMLWSAFIYMMLTGVEGNLITPIVLGRHLRLNSLAVLIGLIFWGWLWGAIGMLLAIPILAVMRVVAEHVEDLRPLGELLRG